jgi:Cys-tRNA(Pro)/Cys-tRNA(Cys) deacylase
VVRPLPKRVALYTIHQPVIKVSTSGPPLDHGCVVEPVPNQPHRGWEATGKGERLRAVTPAVRQLERARHAHRVLSYDHAGGVSWGEDACSQLGLDPSTMFKTLLARTDGGALAVAMVPVVARLALKATARAVGATRVVMADPAAAERATGYVVGGISPFGQRKRSVTVVDESARALPLLYVSGGRRGVELEVAPSALVELLGARFAPLRAC